MEQFNLMVKLRQILHPIALVAILPVLLITVLTIQRLRPRAAETSTAPATLPYSIDQVLGQPNTKETMVNLITPDRGFHLGGIHVDSQGRIYVFDSGNNRILGFSGYSPDRPADIVIGQPSLFQSGTANGDNTTYANPTASTLSLIPYPLVNSPLEAPQEGQMASDSQGNFYVVDLNNNRVLKFNDPFTTDSVADEVWGQPDFTTRTPHCGQQGQNPSSGSFCTDGTSFNSTSVQVFMAAVEIDPSGNLWVADTGNHRVLRFPIADGIISKTADLVLGQTNFDTRQQRPGFDLSLNLLQKPISLKFDSTGRLYILEGEWAGQARVAIFNPPFTTGMTASREIGRAVFQDNQPADTTGWSLIQEKWVQPATGLYWPRGIAFDPSGDGLWVNDTENRRTIKFNASGQIADVLGQPDASTTSCYGLAGQGFINMSGSYQNICEPTGEIGIAPDGSMYIATNAGSDEKSVAIFPLPLRRTGPNNQAIATGRLLFSGWNKFSGRTFQNPAGLALANQLFVADRQRVLVWNNATPSATFSPADFIIGQDQPDQNLNNNGGVFSAIEITTLAAGGDYLWVGTGDRIIAFQLPITAGGKDYPTAKILYPADFPQGNVFWADDHIPVNFRPGGLAYNPVSNALWISDSQNNRVLRVSDPLGDAQVDLVLGQPDKASVSDNAGLTEPTVRNLADPWNIQFDNLGNLYVVDSRYEGGINNRVLRFSSSSLTPIPGNIFPFPSATGVYDKQATNIAFDSQNRLLLLAESYGSPQYQRVYLYPSDHAAQSAPQPSHIIPIATGQAASAAYYRDDSRFVLLDHTWNRVLFVSFTPPALPSSTPAPSPTPPAPVTHLQTIVGTSSNSLFVTTSSPVTAVSGQLYLATIATKPGRGSISSVTGMGLNWTRTISQCSGRNQHRVDIFFALANSNTITGPVTANITRLPKNMVIAVSRFSSSSINPLASANTNGPSGSCLNGVDSKSYSFSTTPLSSGSLVFAAAGIRNRAHTPGPGYTEILEKHFGSSGDVVGLALQTRSSSLPQTLVSGSLSGITDWAVAAVEIK